MTEHDAEQPPSVGEPGPPVDAPGAGYDQVDQVDQAASRPVWRPSDEPGRRRARRGRARGCIPILIVLAIIVVAAAIYVPKAVDSIKDTFGSPDDYPGPGTGRVTFTVAQGDTTNIIGQHLKDAGVVASVESFTDAVAKSTVSLQPGIFVLKKEMSSASVVSYLGDRAHDQSISLTLLPGKSVDEIIGLLAKSTDFKLKQYEQVVAHPGVLDLPAYANGDPEGYLYPGQYQFGPDDTPTTILQAMVGRWREEADKLGLDDKAKELGYTPQEIMTVASMLQAEGRTDDQAKIARVIYNRLEIDGNPSAGFLQIDATVDFALGTPNARLTQEQIDSVADSPYNTYTQKGLPPGPIESPGGPALDAALNPAKGPWFYYVTVNLRTGETKFTDSTAEFQTFKNELDQYCATQSDRC